MKQKYANFLAFFISPIILVIGFITLNKLSNLDVTYNKDYILDYISLEFIVGFFLIYQLAFCIVFFIGGLYYLFLRWINLSKWYSIIPLIFFNILLYIVLLFNNNREDININNNTFIISIATIIVSDIVFWFFLRMGDYTRKEQFIIPICRKIKVLIFSILLATIFIWLYTLFII